ncbi:MAG: glucuronate isomerase [Bacteroidales bacterium]|nr:glucuronate isomerase [Bacteroidales bacterium]
MKLDFITKDFLLETDFARELFHSYARKAPVVDFHNHLSAADIAGDKRHENIGLFWVCADGYKYRAMRMAGFDERYMTGDASPREKFDKWCSLLPHTMGSPLFHWSCMEMKNVFNISEVPDETNCEMVWEACNTLLATPEYSTNSILRGFRVEYATTSDDLLDDVSVHSRATEVSGIYVSPSLRGDSILAFDKESFDPWFRRLGEAKDLQEYLAKVKERLNLFSANGCRLSDHALDNGFSYVKTSFDEAAALFACRKDLTAEGYLKLKSFLLKFLAGEYAERGWVMQLHIGAERWTSSRLRAVAGPAGGYACPGSPCDIRSLCDFLDSLDVRGLLPKTILYTLNPSDNATFATLTGSFSQSGVKKIQFGPAWWYNDHKYGIEENLKNVSAYSLLPGCLGMTTDSRTILSFSRHEYFRRILCNYLGELVRRGELPQDIDFLGEMVLDISYRNAKQWIYE